MLKPFFIWHEKVLKSIHPDDVLFLATEENYTKIVFTDKSYAMARCSLLSILNKMPPDIFIKTHRSFAASVYYIETVERDHMIVGGQTVPIARQFYKDVVKQLNVVE